MGPEEDMFFMGEHSARLILREDSKVKYWMNYWHVDINFE
jgi:hypothetical protein